MTQHNASQNVFAQREQVRKQRISEIQGTEPPQRGQVDKGKAIIAVLADALQQGGGSAAKKLLGQVDQKFQQEQQLFALQQRMRAAEHKERLGLLDDFILKQNEGRAQSREDRAAALAPSQLRVSESGARVAVATEDADIELSRLNVEQAATVLADTKARVAVGQATRLQELKQKRALLSAQIAQSKVEEKQAALILDELETLPPGPRRDALMQGANLQAIQPMTQTEEEAFTEEQFRTDPEMRAAKRIFGKVENIPFAENKRYFAKIDNRKDLKEGEIDPVTAGFRERNLDRRGTRQNVDEAPEGTRPEDNKDAFFIDPKDEKELYTSAISDLAEDVVDGVSRLRYMIAHGSDPADEMKPFFPRELSKSGVFTNKTANKIILDAVNEERRKNGLEPVFFVSPQQAIQNQNPQIGLVEQALGPINQVLEDLKPTRVSQTPLKKNRKMPKVRPSPGAFGA